MNTRDLPEFMRVSPRTVKKIVLAAVCTLLFALLAFDVTGSYHTEWIDREVYRMIHGLESNFMTGFFRLITNTVHPVSMLVISISMLHILKQRQYLLALFGNLILTGLLNLSMKGQFMRSRPPEAFRLVTENGYSFPSGHTMLAVSFFGFLIFLFRRANVKKQTRMIGTVCCLLLAMLVGASRIYLGVHYATDVIGGALLSTIYLILYTGITKRYLKAGIRRKEGEETSSKQKLSSSFVHAFDGILDGLIKERNMMIHYSALVLVVVFGITLGLSVVEWCICVILCVLVIALELMNTAIEAVVDLVTEQWDARAKLAKDTAAGAVLVAAIGAAVIGGVIFIPKIILLFT